jgi:hypothetical protein
MKSVCCKEEVYSKGRYDECKSCGLKQRFESVDTRCFEDQTPAELKIFDGRYFVKIGDSLFEMPSEKDVL